MQRFNRMASEIDLHARPNDVTAPARKRTDKVFFLQVVKKRARARVCVCVYM